MKLRSIALVGLCASVSLSAQPSSAIDKAFEAYWKAGSAADAVRAAERIIKAGVDFDTALAKLRAGRPYKKERAGEFSWRYPGPERTVFDNLIEVPADYDPARTWQVRVQLHGGVNRRGQAAGSGIQIEDDEGGPPSGGARDAPSVGRRRGPNRIPGESQFYLYPSGWADAAWWHIHQVDNILRIVDRLKRQYNIDESKIYLTGISDGGTGTYYMAMRESTPWASFLPLNGSLKVLTNPEIRAEGELYPSNMTNKPLYIVNGGRDPLYPVADVQTHVSIMKQIGIPLVFSPQPAAGHDTTWWRWERTPYERFVQTHARNPHPPRLSWQTERVDRFNRIHWLVIDRLGPGERDAEFAAVEIFPSSKPSGRVDVERKANAIEARTRGVREFTVLASPDAFDLSQPISVNLNGRPAFNSVVKPDVATLFKWAARDNDRTMLYAAEIKVQVP
jgi:predicted esterase